MSEIKVGDVVKLNSGSPDLTVTVLLEKDNIQVEWLQDNQKTGVLRLPKACFTLKAN